MNLSFLLGVVSFTFSFGLSSGLFVFCVILNILFSTVLVIFKQLTDAIVSLVRAYLHSIESCRTLVSDDDSSLFIPKA